MVASFSCRRISWLGLLAVLVCSLAAAEIAREIRSRSQKVLRNPAGHEGGQALSERV